WGRGWVGEGGVAVVGTGHNYRFACARGTLFRDGHVCTDCGPGRPWPGLRHRCYRDSVIATAPLALAVRAGPAADPVLARADRVLCLSDRQRRMLADAGLARGRLVAWSNFLPAGAVPPRPRAAADGRGGAPAAGPRR